MTRICRTLAATALDTRGASTLEYLSAAALLAGLALLVVASLGGPLQDLYRGVVAVVAGTS
jgi:hypothetical protein